MCSQGRGLRAGEAAGDQRRGRREVGEEEEEEKSRPGVLRLRGGAAPAVPAPDPADQTRPGGVPEAQGAAGGGPVPHLGQPPARHTRALQGRRGQDGGRPGEADREEGEVQPQEALQRRRRHRLHQREERQVQPEGGEVLREIHGGDQTEPGAGHSRVSPNRNRPSLGRGGAVRAWHGSAHSCPLSVQTNFSLYQWIGAVAL